jgi:hypothetical protein
MNTNMEHSHAVNAAVIAAPIVSFFTEASPVITGVAGLCAITWYVWLAYKEYLHWKRRHNSL